MEKTCLNCNERIIGRSDKKFCSAYCRNTYNNQQNRNETTYMREVHKILRQNRKALMQLNPKGKAVATKEDMLKAGYNFSYFTSVYKTKKGSVYYFVYEYGWLKVEDDKYALVLKEEWIK